MTSQRFPGFVSGGAATTLPAQFFVEVLPQIDDEAELRVTLYVLYAIARKRGQLRAVRVSDLTREEPVARSIAHCGGMEALRPALRRAITRGTLVACPLADGDALLFLNNDAGRRALLRVRSGALQVRGARPVRAQPVERPSAPAEVYEQEIGVLTPAIAEALAAASERWPEQWVVDALRMAAARNARSWRYAEAILTRWEAEGRDDATTGAAAASSGAGVANRGQGPRDHGPYEKVIRRS